MIAGLEGGTLEKNAAKILGYSCDKVVAMGGTTAYTISGTDIPLRIQGGATMGGITINEEATNISKSEPSASTFKIPSNIQIEHNKQADMMMQAHAKDVIQNLLQGKKSTQMQAPPAQGGGQPQMTPEQQEQMKKMMQMFGNQ